jgi:hypothetical protein
MCLIVAVIVRRHRALDEHHLQQTKDKRQHEGD